MLSTLRASCRYVIIITHEPQQISYQLQVPKFPNRSTEVKSSSLVKNVRCIAWSCDGRRVATGTELKGIRIWEVSKDRVGVKLAFVPEEAETWQIETSTSFPLPSGGEKTTPHTGHVGESQIGLSVGN